MTKTPRLVIVESPYACDVARNVEYARRCVRDSIERGEAPIASHLLFTQPGILNDEDPEERRRGIAAGLAWLRVAELSAVYVDHGISAGMKCGIEAAKAAGIFYEYRRIGEQPERRGLGGGGGGSGGAFAGGTIGGSVIIHPYSEGKKL